MSEKTQRKWEDRVERFISDWFFPDEDGVPDAYDEWFKVCGKNGSDLKKELCERDLMGVLTICYRLVIMALSLEDELDVKSQADSVSDFLGDCQSRLNLPCLELKHIWSAEQWHDYNSVVPVLISQDLKRAKMCLREAESGQFYPSHLQWPWRTPAIIGKLFP